MKKYWIILLLLIAIPVYGADTKISAMTDGAASVATTNIVPVVIGGANYRLTLANIFGLKIGTLTNTNLCTTDGTVINCTTAPTTYQAADADLNSLGAGITGLVKGAGNGGGYSAVIMGVDALAPAGSGAALTGITGNQIAPPTVQTVTCNDSGDANHGTLTITPTVGLMGGQINLVVNDAHGCTITMSEVGAVDQSIYTITNISANHADFADQAGILEMMGSLDLSQSESVTLKYTNSQLYEKSRAVTSSRNITIAGFTASRNAEIDASGNLIASDTATTGSGAPVKATGPTLVTPILGVATGTSLALTGNLSGLLPTKVITSASGVHDTGANASTLVDSGESFVDHSYIGMTLYNITDVSSCTVTHSDGTSMECTLTGGTDNDWDVNDVWQVGPGPSQSGSWWYVTNAGTIRHPATAGYASCYESDAAAALTIDMASASMIFQGTLDTAVVALDAGDSIDSSGSTTGDFMCIHNKSATEAQGKGKRGTWVDGGAT
jgi:hypothetical protein